MRKNLFLRLALLWMVCVLGMPAAAAAQGFISPFIGFFGDDSACPSLTDCEGKRIHAGVGGGVLGRVAGFEAELGYAKDFFADQPGFESDMLTLMGNLLIAPKIGFARPYGVIGAGLMRSTATLTGANLLVSDNNNFGWDFGGGLMLFFGSHVGIRGDLRVFRSLQDVQVLGFTLSDSKINFGRVAGAVMFVF